MSFKKINNPINRIIISRTDAIGDVILTLPIAGVLKQQLPNTKVVFLGRNYTKAIVQQSRFVDEFISWDNLEVLSPKECIQALEQIKADAIVHVFPNATIAKRAKQAKIPFRIGTSRRIFHWTTCNVKVQLSRKKSSLHEAQLNLKLLAPLGIKTDYDLKTLPDFYGFSIPQQPSEKVQALLSKDKFNLILHAKSHGSAREWGIDNFLKLIDLLPQEQFRIFISGTDKEKNELTPLREHPKTVDVCSFFNLEEFIQFIALADGLMAASTGPLHIAAAFGKKAIGVYPVARAMHPRRWAPVGKQAKFLIFDEHCPVCGSGKFCECIRKIEPQLIADLLI